ncbi:MAG: nucleotide exchange factor GrpE [Planctomycetes bacterium]|nr:nucleotide exchange factor GrpE [Planctomycetota bacterium]
MRGRDPERDGPEDPATDRDEGRDAPEAPEAIETPPGEPDGGESAAPDGGVLVAEERLAELERKAEERDKYLQELQRRAADFDNYRKRMIRERESWQFAGLERFLRAFVPVLDDLRRALTSSPERYSDPAKVFEGLVCIDAQIEKVLSEFGVTRIPARGEPFDPNVHEAVAVRELDGVPDGTIVEEFRQGYRFRDTVLRAPQVMVARNPGGQGGPGDASVEEPLDDEPMEDDPLA